MFFRRNFREEDGMKDGKRLLPQIGRVAAVVAAIALIAACASGPEPAPAPDGEYDEAKALRSRIEQNDLATYAPSEYDAGEAAFAAGETAYEAEDYGTAKTEFDSAITNYRDVIRAGYRAIASARKGSADTEKQKADDIKAAVAVADDYEEALAIYQAAAAAEADGDDETAAELYENAATLFLEVYELAAEKRAAALDALNRATERTSGLNAQRESLEQEAREDLEDADAAAEGSTSEGGDE
jgi:tetratricopeptide (TPR) repeat protein